MNRLPIRPVSVIEARIRLEIIKPKLELIQSKLLLHRETEKTFASSDFTEYSKIRYRLGVLEEEIHDIHHEIIDLDCLVKDMNTGLVDFIAMRDEGPVWLCFKLGEDGLDYYHGMNDGYIGRKLIDF